MDEITQAARAWFNRNLAEIERQHTLEAAAVLLYGAGYTAGLEGGAAPQQVTEEMVERAHRVQMSELLSLCQTGPWRCLFLHG